MSNDEPTCARCQNEYALRDGQDPTKYCDKCAHLVVEELERASIANDSKKYQAQNAEAKATIELAAWRWLSIMCRLVQARITRNPFFRYFFVESFR